MKNLNHRSLIIFGLVNVFAFFGTIGVIYASTPTKPFMPIKQSGWILENKVMGHSPVTSDDLPGSEK